MQRLVIFIYPIRNPPPARISLHNDITNNGGRKMVLEIKPGLEIGVQLGAMTGLQSGGEDTYNALSRSFSVTTSTTG